MSIRLHMEERRKEKKKKKKRSLLLKRLPLSGRLGHQPDGLHRASVRKCCHHRSTTFAGHRAGLLKTIWSADHQGLDALNTMRMCMCGRCLGKVTDATGLSWQNLRPGGHPGWHLVSTPSRCSSHRYRPRLVQQLQARAASELPSSSQQLCSGGCPSLPR